MAKAQNTIEIKANGRMLTATLADSEAARQLGTRLASGDVTVRMNDYGGFEKVGDLPWSLPATDSRITTVPGDIMLYQGRSIVIFYGTNTWAYTPLAKIDGVGAVEIRNLLSGSSVDVTFSLSGSGVDDITADGAGNDAEPVVYNLQGRRIDLGGRSVNELPKGVYIVNGKKQLVK